jgi:hypothetical protein
MEYIVTVLPNDRPQRERLGFRVDPPTHCHGCLKRLETVFVRNRWGKDVCVTCNGMTMDEMYRFAGQLGDEHGTMFEIQREENTYSRVW